MMSNSATRELPLTSHGIRIIQSFDGLIHWHDQRLIIGSKGTSLFISRDHGKSFDHLTEIPAGIVASLRASTRLLRRLFRSGVHHVLLVADQYLVVFFDRYILCFDLVAKQWFPHQSRIIGKRPIIVTAYEQRLFYGEYRGNPERSPVDLFVSEDLGATWRTQFVLDNVRHFHGIFWDEFERCFWFTTGDEDNESALWRIHDVATPPTPVLSGAQKFRIVQPIFTEEYIYFGSDSTSEQNAIYRYHRVQHSVEELFRVNGPIFYSCATSSHLLFSTVSERLCTADGVVQVIASSDGASWQPVFSINKDMWSYKLFQYGQIRFPSGPRFLNETWISMFATEEDQLSYCIQFES